MHPSKQGSKSRKTMLNQKPHTWVEATCPTSLAQEVFDLWQDIATEGGATCFGTVGEHAPTTISPNGYWIEGSSSMLFCFPGLTKAEEWMRDQSPSPFSARLHIPNSDPTKISTWVYGTPKIEIAPGVTHTDRPEAVLRIRQSRHHPVSSSTWATVIRTLERLNVIGSLKDRRSNSLLIPVCRQSQAVALQSDLVSILPNELLIDLILPEELESEHVYLAVAVKSASTTTDAPLETHQHLDAILGALYGVLLDHDGDPTGEDVAKPFETIVGVHNVLGALSCRVAWRGHGIAGDTLLWTLRDPVKDRLSPEITSRLSLSRLRRSPSPTSSIGQGRAKRQRTDSKAPLQGTVVQGGPGDTESNPIDVDAEDGDMTGAMPLPAPSVKRPPVLYSTRTVSKQELAPIQFRKGPASHPSTDKRKMPSEISLPTATVWVRATCPLAFGREAFAMWRKSLEKKPGMKFGCNSSRSPEIETSPLGFPVGGTASLYIGFLRSSDANAWQARHDQRPFYVSILKKKDNPTEKAGWEPGMPALGDIYDPEVVIRVTARDEDTKNDNRKQWMTLFELYGILAFDNHADHSIWVPARTRAIGEKFCLGNWTKSSSLVPNTSVEVIDLAHLKMEHASLGITLAVDHSPTSTQRAHKGLRDLLAQLFPGRIDTMNEHLAAWGIIDHTIVTFKTTRAAMNCAVVWRGVWKDYSKCFLRGPVTRQNQSAIRTPSAVKKPADVRQRDPASPPPSVPTHPLSPHVEDEDEFTSDEESTEDPTIRGWVKVPIPPLQNLAKASPEEIETIKEESRHFIRTWFTSHNCVVPSEQEIEEVLELLPKSPQWYSALSYARKNKGNSIHALVTAISEWNTGSDQTIGPDTPAIYIASVQAVTKCIAELCSRLGNVSGAQRDRMRATMMTVADDLSAAGHGPDYIASLLYAGSTWRLGGRSKFDAKNFGFNGAPLQDRRQPLIVAETVAAGAKTIDDCSFVTLDPKGAYMNGHRDVILGPDGQIRRDEHGNVKFPAVCRLPVISILDAPRHLWHLLESIVAALCSPAQLNVKLGGLARHRLDTSMVELLKSRVSIGADAEVLFLGDATGVKGRSFEDSITGHLFVLMVEDYTGQCNIKIRFHNWVSAEGHESNDEIVTPTT